MDGQYGIDDMIWTRATTCVRFAAMLHTATPAEREEASPSLASVQRVSDLSNQSPFQLLSLVLLS